MRLVFAGTPEPAVVSLRALAGTDHEIAAVITRDDAPRGRKRVLTASETADAAADLDIPTIKADRLDAAVSARVGALEPDLGVIVAYGGLVREPLLSTPRLGWINLHFSLLPRWRGAAPVQHALIAGDTVTGASVFQLVLELDAGDVFATREWPVPPQATAGDALAALSTLGAELLVETVDALASGTAHARPQEGEPTFAPKLTAQDGRIRWSEDTDAVLARVRGTTPEPGAHTTIDDARLKVLAAHRGDRDIMLAPGAVRLVDGTVYAGTGTHAIALERVQPAGKTPQAASDWWRGLRTDDPVLR